jgi:hypothetical protein
MNFLHCEPDKVPPAVNYSAAAVCILLLACAGLSAQSSFRNGSSAKDPSTKDISKYLINKDLRAAARPKDPPLLPADVIVDKVMATNAHRSAEVRGFQDTRSYHLQYHGLFGARDASMQVVATYNAPDQRNFSVISQTGSKLLLNRVLLKLLDSEKEAFRNRKQVELSPDNYQFELVGVDREPGGSPAYVLAVKPRKDNKFLYHGKIWVDANDFAVVKMEGQPAKSPSFWIKDTDIESNWTKVGDFWLIANSTSTSHIRMGGMATLTIDYGNYQITGIDKRAPQTHSQSPVLPDPSAVTPQR